MLLWAKTIGAIIPAGELIVELDLHDPVIVTVDPFTGGAIEGRPEPIHLVERCGITGKDGRLQRPSGGCGNPFRAHAPEALLDKLVLFIQGQCGCHQPTVGAIKICADGHR